MTRRYLGVDVARGLAIVGMLVLHTVPAAAAPILQILVGESRPQILFAILDGVALGLICRTAPTHRQARRIISVRAVAFVALGLWLTSLGSGVVVILDSYGIYFLLVLPVLFAPGWLIATIAALLLVAGPWVTTALAGTPESAEFIPITAQIDAWLFTGAYPAVVWLGYVFVGLLAARTDAFATRHGLRIAAVCGCVGVAVALAAPWLSEVSEWTRPVVLAGTTALMLGLVAALGWLLDVRGSARLSRTLLAPLAALGSMPITVYAVHVVALAVLAHVGAPQQSLPTFAILLASLAAFATVWRPILGRGPLERAIRALTESEEEVAGAGFEPATSRL